MTAPLRYAGFWRRFVAHVVDSIVLNAVTYLIQVVLLAMIYFAFRGQLSRPASAGVFGFLDAFNDLYVMYFNGGLYICLCFPYFVWGHFRYQATLGKKLVGVRTVARDGGRMTLNQAIGRWAGYALSYLPFGAGFLMAGFHPEKRALHDLLAGTVSIIAPETASSAAPAQPSV